MSLKALMQSHDYKYISVMDFIKLVANHTNDTSDIVIEYLCKFCLVDNDDVRIYIKGFANDYSNEFHLSDLIFKDDKIDDFRCYTMSELEKDNEFLISYFLKDEIFNAKYIKVLNLKTDNDKPQATNSDEVSAPTSTIELGEYQKLLISYELFTPEQIVCLMIDENPASISHNDKYLAHCDRVSTALDANALTPINDKDQIASAQVKSWLARCGLIYKGFNDYVIEEDDPLQKSIDDTTEILSIVYDDNKSKDKEIEQLATEYEELRLEYQALEQRLADKETNASFMMGNPTVKQTDPLNNSQLIKELAASKAQIANLERQLKQANTALADVPAANARIKQQEQDIKRLNDQLSQQADLLADKHLYDWQTMDKNQYPPELHLAMVIWREYYQADAMKYITQFDSSRFNRISTKLNLSNGNLKDRIRTLLTPLESKLKSPLLIASFKVIDTIHTDKLEQD